MKKMIKIFNFAAIFILPFFLISCQDYRDIEPLSTTGTLYMTADENFEPAVNELIKEFERLNVKAKVEVNYVPTKNAVAELVNNQTNFIVITRPFNEEESSIIKEHNIEIDSHQIAVDAVSFIVNPKNPLLRITSEDLKKIFTGEITSWTDIKSQDEQQNREVTSTMTGNLNRIRPYIQRPNSGTYDFVKNNILAGADFYDKAIVCTTSTQVLNMVRENENAIGITNLAWLGIGKQDVLDSTVKPLRISLITETGSQRDYVQLHQGLVFNGKYPYNRVVYVYTTIKGVGIETGFISFILHTPGQQALLNHGVVPSAQPVRTIQLN